MMKMVMETMQTLMMALIQIDNGFIFVKIGLLVV